MKAGQAWRSLLEGRSTVVSLPSWAVEAEHWELHHGEVPWEQLVLHKVLAGRMLKAEEVDILGEHMLAWEVRMGLTRQQVGRRPEERKCLHHQQEQVLT